MPARNVLLLIIKRKYWNVDLFVEDIYILLIILYHFAGSVSTTANTNCLYVKCIRKKDTSRLKLS